MDYISSFTLESAGPSTLALNEVQKIYTANIILKIDKLWWDNFITFSILACTY